MKMKHVTQFILTLSTLLMEDTTCAIMCRNNMKNRDKKIISLSSSCVQKILIHRMITYVKFRYPPSDFTILPNGLPNDDVGDDPHLLYISPASLFSRMIYPITTSMVEPKGRIMKYVK